MQKFKCAQKYTPQMLASTSSTLTDTDKFITDNRYKKELNDDLSHKRANFLMEYLRANETLPTEKLMAVGYGSQKPIASNKSKYGRSLNRRIDVIIKSGTN